MSELATPKSSMDHTHMTEEQAETLFCYIARGRFRRIAMTSAMKRGEEYMRQIEECAACSEVYKKHLREGKKEFTSRIGKEVQAQKTS